MNAAQSSSGKSSKGAQAAKPPARGPRADAKTHAAAVSRMNLADPALPGGAPPKAAQEIQMVSTIRLTLDQVDPFEDNPRTKQNEAYLDIRESIRARGLDSIMWVTRRPGEKKYVLAKGGGTRYASLRDLWQETKDRKFFELDFNYCDYRSELDLLAAHLSENVNRGGMCFWDKARGTITLKDEIEAANGDLTYSDTIEQFKKLGLPDVARSLLAVYQFATDKLHALDSSVYALTMLAVRDTLQPGYNAYLRVAEKAGFEDFDTKVWLPALEEFGVTHGEAAGAAEWHKLMTAVEEAFAAELNITGETLRQVLRTLKQTPDAATATWEQLLPPPPASPAQAGGVTVPAGTDDGARNISPSETQPTGNRLRQQPATFARAGGTNSAAAVEPEDGDRPPAGIVEQVEAEQRSKAREVVRATPTAAVPTSPPEPTTERDAVRLNKRALLSLATYLASRSKTLEGSVLERADLVMGWMVDLPADVLAGTPLPPQAKELFWFLARASFQFHIGVNQPEQLAGTRFAEFLQAPPESQSWDLIRPDGGFDFLMSWLIDPEYASMGVPAARMLSITRDLVANHPDEFMELGAALDFQDLQENHQAQRRQLEQEALGYYLENGASQDMVRLLFPHADLATARFRPGRVADIDLKTAQRLYDVWDDLCREIPSDRERFVRLHQVFPQVSLASLYSAITEVQP